MTWPNKMKPITCGEVVLGDKPYAQGLRIAKFTYTGGGSLRLSMIVRDNVLIKMIDHALVPDMHLGLRTEATNRA